MVPFGTRFKGYVAAAVAGRRIFRAWARPGLEPGTTVVFVADLGLGGRTCRLEVATPGLEVPGREFKRQEFTVSGRELEGDGKRERLTIRSGARELSFVLGSTFVVPCRNGSSVSAAELCN